MDIYTHERLFNSHFPGKPGMPSFDLILSLAKGFWRENLYRPEALTDAQPTEKQQPTL